MRKAFQVCTWLAVVVFLVVALFGASIFQVYQGGTGRSTLTAHGVLLGQGSSAIVASSAGGSGTCFMGNGASSDPTFQACPSSSSGGDYSSLAASLTCSSCTISGAKILPSASVNSFTVSTVPGGFQNLRASCSVQTTSGSLQGFRIRYNSDSGSNYAWNFVGNGSGNSGADTSGVLGFASPTASTNIFSSTTVDIVQYANTSVYKSSNSLSYANSQPGMYIIGSYWKNTAAITSITFLLDAGGNFGTNSVCTLDGYN